MAPPLNGILETAIYVDDIERADEFYRTVIGLQPMFESERLNAYDAGPEMVLLVCQRGQTNHDQETPGGLVPGHISEGPAHFAFKIGREHLDPWRDHLKEQGVPIRSEVTWSAGGTSLYFYDPDGNVVELGTPGIWSNFPA